MIKMLTIAASLAAALTANLALTARAETLPTRPVAAIDDVKPPVFVFARLLASTSTVALPPTQVVVADDVKPPVFVFASLLASAATETRALAIEMPAVRVWTDESHPPPKGFFDQPADDADARQ